MCVIIVVRRAKTVDSSFDTLLLAIDTSSPAAPLAYLAPEVATLILILLESTKSMGTVDCSWSRILYENLLFSL